MDMNDFPGISIVIAVLNEEDHIAECIDSLINQTYPGKTEIIAVDGGSEDRTIEILEELQNRYDNIRWLKNPHKIQPAGRNLAIKNSIYDLVAYIDGHSYADRNWLKRLYETFSEIKKVNPKICGVGSKYFNANNNKFTKSAEALFSSFLAGAGKQHFLNKKEVSKTNNAYACLYDKHLLCECGLYDESLKTGEDIELNQRLVKYGYDLYIDHLAIIFYYRKESFVELFKQQYRYGFWRMKVMRKLKIFSIAPFLPGLFVLVLSILIIFSIIDKNNAFILGNFIFYYLLIVFLLSAIIASSKKSNIFTVVLMTVILHVSYGLGILTGIFKRG